MTLKVIESIIGIFDDVTGRLAAISPAGTSDVSYVPTSDTPLVGAPVMAQNDPVTGRVESSVSPTILADAIRGSLYTNPITSPRNTQCTITVTGSAGGSDLATVYQLSTNQDKFAFYGGAYFNSGDPTNFPMKSSSVASGNAGVPGLYSTRNCIEVNTTASKIRLKSYVGGGSAAFSSFRVIVDGSAVVKNAQVQLTAAGVSAGNVVMIDADFTSFGGAGTVRNVRFEWDDGVTPGFISHTNDGSMWKPAMSRPRVCFFGDSFFAGGTGGAANPPTYMLENVAVRTAALLGWEATCCAVGGTGFVNNGGSNYAFNNPIRLADLTLQPFDAFVIATSHNDGGTTLAGIQSSALTVMQAARAARPKAPIIVMGMINGLVSSTLSTADIENAIKSAFDTFADANSKWIPCITDPDGAWITAANKAAFIAADNTHLRPKIGEQYAAEKLAAAIAARLI